MGSRTPLSKKYGARNAADWRTDNYVAKAEADAT